MKTSRRVPGSRKGCRKPSRNSKGRLDGRTAVSPFAAPLVRVLWRDAYVLSEGWAGRADTGRPGDDDCLVWSVGFLIARDRNYIRIARDVIIDVKGETVGGVLSIPTGFVVKVERHGAPS